MMRPPRQRQNGLPSALCAWAFGACILASAAHSQSGAAAVQTRIDNVASSITRSSGARVPDSILEIARKRLAGGTEDDGTEDERGAALLLLGLAQQKRDFELLRDTAEESANARLRDRATIALGFHASASARLDLEARLSARSQGSAGEDAYKAVVAFALGLAAEAGQPSSALKMHALEILRRSRQRHASQLAACLAALPADEGRSVLEQVLNLRALPIRGPFDRGDDALAGSTVQRVALAALARRFATGAEWILVRGALTRRDVETRRLACHGILQRGPRGLGKRMRAKIARDLERRLSDTDDDVRGLALLALARFDEKKSLARARRIVDRRSARPRALESAFLVLGDAGSAKDRNRLSAWQTRKLEPVAQSAWCLAAAKLARRMDADAFPPKGDEAPFPLPALRAWIRDDNSAALARSAAALALARLGDRKSAGAVKAYFLAHRSNTHARMLASASIRLDSGAFDGGRAAPRNDRALLAWSLVASPQLWKPLQEALEGEGISSERRAGLLTLAAIAAAGPTGDLDKRVRNRISSTNSLPRVLHDIAGWLDAGRARAMMSDRRPRR